MTELEFIKAKFGKNLIEIEKLFSPEDLAALIEEYNEIQSHIKEFHVIIDDRPIYVKEWIDYNKQYKRWKKKYEGRMNTMDAGMSQPNKPNYFRANND